MYIMVEFMGQCYYVVWFVQIVEYYIGVYGVDGWMGKSVWCFVWFYVCVDLVFVKEWLCQFGYVWVEIVIGVYYGLMGFGLVYDLVVFYWQRCVVVLDLYFIKVELFCFQFVILV